jgi:hypothetical protein
MTTITGPMKANVLWIVSSIRIADSVIPTTCPQKYWSGGKMRGWPVHTGKQDMEAYRKSFPNGFIRHALLITWHKGPAHPAPPNE